MTKPNVLIAGFPRCSSTYLYNVLKQHPDVGVSEIKELDYLSQTHYFLEKPNIKSPRSKKSFEWYQEQFPDKKVVIDFSIKSSYAEESANRIRELLGDIKIIFLIRNKEDHIKSMCRTSYHKDCIYNDFDLYKDGDYEYKVYSNFDNYIKKYKDVFSNVKVFNVVDNSSLEIKKICKFLELDDFDFDFNVGKNEYKKDYDLPKKSIIYKFKRRLLGNFFVYKINEMLNQIRKENLKIDC